MFELEGVEYTLEDVQIAADMSGKKIEDYITEAGLKKIQEPKPEPAKTPRADQGASVQPDVAPAMESSSVDSSSEQPDPPSDNFYLYKDKKYSALELEALSMNEGLSQGDAFVLTTPDGEETYSYDEIKEVADQSGLTPESYLQKFKQNPKYGAKVIPGGLDIQVGIELEPVEVIGSFSGASDELKKDAKKIKRKVEQLPEEERFRAYELAFRGYDEEEREVLSNLIQGPKDFETPEDATNYINAKTETLGYMVNTIEKELKGVEVKSFINNATGLAQSISDLSSRLKSASAEEAPEIERQLNEKAREYGSLIENNKYSISKLNNLEKLRKGVVEESAKLTAKAQQYADDATVQEAVDKRYDLTSKVVQSLDEGFSGILNSVYIPAVSLFDKDMAKAEAIYQGARLERGRSRISRDLDFGEAGDVGYLKYAAETLATNAFSTVASVLTYSGPQGLIMAPITFGLSQGGGTYTDLMYRRDAAGLSIKALEKQYDNATTQEARDRISTEINELEGVKNYSDSDIITASTASAAIEGLLTFGAGKLGQTVVPKAIKKIPKLDKFTNFVDSKGITNKLAGVFVGEVAEESSIALMNAAVVDAFVLDKDVDFSQVVNVDFVAKTIISSAGTSGISGGSQALGFIANAGTTINDRRLRNNIQKQLQGINEQMKTATPQEAERLRTKASALLEQVTRNKEEATARFGNLDKDETAKVFNNYVKMQKIRKKASQVAGKVVADERKALDPAAKSRIDDLQKQYDKLHAENSQILNPETEAKNKDVNAEETYLIDYYRSMKGLAKTKSKGISIGENSEEAKVIGKLVGRELTYDGAMEFVDMIRNNKDFKSLSAKDQKDIMAYFMKPENDELASLGLSVPSPNMVNINNAIRTPGMYTGGFIMMNTPVTHLGILDRQRSLTSKMMSVNAPIHEALHDYTAKVGISEDKMKQLGVDALKVIQKKREAGEISDSDFQFIDKRIGLYRKFEGGITTGFYEEMMNLYHDLVFSGVLSDKDVSNLHSFKDFIAETRKRFAGPIGSILKRNTDGVGSDVKNHLKGFKQYMVNKTSAELGDGRGPNRASLDEYDLSQFDDIQGEDGSQFEDEYVSEFDDFEASLYNEENQIQKESKKKPTLVEKYLGRKSRDITPLKKGNRKGKKRAKRAPGEISTKGQKSRERLNALAEKKGKIDLQDPETAKTIFDFFDSYTPVILRTWVTNKGVVMNMEKQFGLDPKDLAADLYGNMRKYLEKFDVAKYDADGNKISGNDNFYGYINAQMRRRMGGIFKKLMEDNPAVPSVQATEVKSLATDDPSYAADFAFNQSDRPRRKLIDPNDILIDEDKSRLLDIVSNDLGTSDISELSFKTTTSSAAEILSQYVGIPLHKIINTESSYSGPSKVTLKNSELASGQKWIFQNRNRLKKLLPYGAIETGAADTLINTGTRVPGNLLKVFYEKGERVTTDAGHFPFRKIASITDEHFLRAFGMDVDGKPDPRVGPRNPEGQSVKAIINLYARMMSNLAMREVLAERGASPNQINDIAAGKSDFMLSIGDSNIDDLMRDKIAYISLNDRELAAITTATLLSAGFSAKNVEQTVKAYRNILNDNRSMYVGREKGQSLSSFINKDMFEMMDPLQSIRQTTATLGTNLDSFVDAENGDFTPTEIGKVLRGKTLPNIVDSLEDHGMAYEQSVMTLARMLRGSMTNETSSTMFKNQGDVATYLNNQFKQGLAGGKYMAADIKNGKFVENENADGLYYTDSSGSIFQIQSINVDNTAAMNLGLDKVLDGKGFNELNGGKLAEQANLARRDLLYFFESMQDLRGTMSTEEVAALVSAMLEGKNNIFTRAATHDAVVLDESAKPEDYVFDVRPPTSYIARYIAAYLMDKNVPMSAMRSLVDNIKGIWVTKNMLADAQALSRNTMQVGWTPDQPGAFAIYEEIADIKGLKVTMSSEVLGTDEQQEFESLKDSKKKELKPKKKIRTSRTQEVLSKVSEEEKSYLEEKFDEMISDKYSEKNPHLEDLMLTPGVEIGAATAKNIASKVKWYKRWNLIPHTADDFIGLLYYFLEKGKAGEADLQFFKENLIRPFNQAYITLNRIRQEVATNYRAANKKHASAVERLRKYGKGEMNYANWTNEQAIKVFLYTKAGYDIPDMSVDEAMDFVRYVQNDPELLAYAKDLNKAINIDEYWIEPDKSWAVRSIKDDVHRVTEEYMRSRLLDTWIKNKDEIFSKANLNKIEAVYGTKFRSSLEDSLYRMQHGTSRPEGENGAVNVGLNWFRGSVATTMFLNTRSAMLQTISAFNYLNWDDNNPAAAMEAAFANPKQWVKDIKAIYGSDYIRQRFGGLKHDLDMADLYRALDSESAAWKTSKDIARFVLQKGYILTRFGDAFAISFGGAAFYRNRTNKYISEGMSKIEAEKKAFEDFQEVTEESQQSSRPDKLSKEQTSTIGRVMLAFQNTTMQYTRIMNKAARDIIAGRGDLKENLGKILYYGAIQNFMFSALQTGLLNMLFDSDVEEEELDAKGWMVGNNMIDAILRGTGVVGALASTAKNVAIRAKKEYDKGYRGDYKDAVYESLNASPAIGIKYRKWSNAANNLNYNTESMKEMGGLDFKSPKDFGYSLYNPAFDVTGDLASATLNIPIDRAFDKIKNMTVALDGDRDISNLERSLIMLGWSPWSLGVDVDEVAKSKARIKKAKKAKKDAIREAKKKEKESSNKTKSRSGKSRINRGKTKKRG